MSAARRPMRLSEKAVAVMEMIAEGNAYAQIIAAHPEITYRDIFEAAAEVLRAITATPEELSHMEKLRSRHPRAYESWTEAEEEQLRRLIEEGHTVARIATHLQRNRGAIRARIIRLGIIDLLSPKEKERFSRIIERQGLSDEGPETSGRSAHGG